MRIAHEKLAGLDRDKIVAALEPVISIHGVDCVELVWKTDRGEALLEVTVERPETRDPGAGVTLDLISEISRDLSAALDAADCIDRSYRPSAGARVRDRLAATASKALSGLCTTACQPLGSFSDEAAKRGVSGQ